MSFDETQARLVLDKIQASQNMKLDVSSLMQRGAIVDLDITSWPAYTNLKPEDLGIVPSDDADQKRLAQIMKLGQVSQLAPEWRKRQTAAENAGRTTLLRYAFRTLNSYFVPVSAYEQWSDANMRARNSLFVFRDELYAQWDDMRFSLEMYYREMAEQAWSNLPAGRQASLSAGEFKTLYVNSLLGRLPSRDTATKLYTYRTNLSFFDLSPVLPQALVAGTRWSEKKLLDDLMRSQEIKREEAATTFLADVQEQLLKAIGEIAVNAAEEADENLGTGKGLSGGVVKGLRVVAERALLMNVTGDDEISRLATELASYANDYKPKDRVSLRSAIRRTMRAIALVAKAKLADVGRGDTLDLRGVLGMGMNGEEATNMEEAVRGARQRFGFPVYDDVELVTPSVRVTPTVVDKIVTTPVMVAIGDGEPVPATVKNEDLPVVLTPLSDALTAAAKESFLTASAGPRRADETSREYSERVVESSKNVREAYGKLVDATVAPEPEMMVRRPLRRLPD